MPLDVAATRAQFPALSRPGPDGRPFVHADAPGGTQVHETVITAMSEYLARSNANTHGSFLTSRETDALVDVTRARIGDLLGSSSEGVVFGPNMTTLTWHLAHALDERLATGGEIVCTRLDHDANVAPWLALAERTGTTVRFVDVDEDGALRVEQLGDLVTRRTRLVTFPAASNALGTVVDPAPFVAAARDVGALTFMDAVHAAPHLPLRREALGVDVLACSPYKFFGPHSGLLVADSELLAELGPDKVRAAPDTGPDRWQTGTASFEAIAGIGAAVAYLDAVGMDAIVAHERDLTRRFLEGLADLDHGVRLHGAWEGQRTPTFAVTFAAHSPGEAAAVLAERGIFAWHGHYYALEPMRALGLLEDGGAVRIGFVHYHGVDDVDRVLDALTDLAG